MEANEIHDEGLILFLSLRLSLSCRTPSQSLPSPPIISIAFTSSLQEPPSCGYFCRLDEALEQGGSLRRKEEGVQSCFSSDPGCLSLALVCSASQGASRHLLPKIGVEIYGHV